MCHFLRIRSMVSKVDLVKMDGASIEETRKVSFDDLVSESMGGEDESSIEGLVSVAEDCPLQSEPLPQLPAIYSSDRSVSTPDLYSCFDPPQNPERMRRRPKYVTITATPDYCRMYRSYNWRRVSFDTDGGRKRSRDEDDYDSASREESKYRFRHLLRRFAFYMRRSEESRSTILQHRKELIKLIDLDKDVEEVLSNDTRPKILDMVRTELDYVEHGGEKEDEGSNEDEMDSYYRAS